MTFKGENVFRAKMKEDTIMIRGIDRTQIRNDTKDLNASGPTLIVASHMEINVLIWK